MKTPEIRLGKTLRRDGRTGFTLHPWIFSGAVASAPADIPPGSLVKVFDAGGAFVCYGHYNGGSSIRVRAISQNEDEIPDLDYMAAKIARAAAFRRSLGFDSDSWRVVFSESDGLPGLVIDKFGDFAAMQTTTAGMDNLKVELADIAMRECGVRGIVERNDCEIRRLEGLPSKSGMLAGAEPPGELVITENKLKFAVNLLHGQKTGFFLDQRENRISLAKFARPGMELLDAFCFSGAFSVYCASRGLSSLNLLDESADALDLARRNMSLNGFGALSVEYHKGDAFSLLRKFRDSRRSFDMVLLDPPKFAPTRKDAEKAERGYKDINLLGMKLLRDGGMLATFSCSSGISRERFRTILEHAARVYGREIAILATLGQGADHPVPLSFPEAEYLKGYVLRVQ